MAMESLLQQNQNAIRGLSENFTVPLAGPLMRLLSFPIGSPYAGTFCYYVFPSILLTETKLA